MMKKILLIGLIMALALSASACGNSKEESSVDNTGNETAAVEEKEDETFTISAGGIELKYPLKWKDKVTVTTSEDRVCFACGETKIFDLTFNVDEGYVLGTIIGDTYTVVRLVDYPFESEDREMYEMQEDVDIILQNLMNDYTFDIGGALE